MDRSWKKLLVSAWLGFILWMAACSLSADSEAVIVSLSPPPFTSTPTIGAVQSSTSNEQLSPASSATPSAIPTSTPWPTVDPTIYATLYVTPTHTFVPTPNYYAQMKDMYRLMVGEWWGKMGVSVNRQGRKVQYVVVVFYRQCEMGQICGSYHIENGCFGELVLDNWRPTFLVFRNLEYSGSASCPDWRPMSVRPLVNDRLAFSFGYRNQEEKWVSKGVVLRRK